MKDKRLYYVILLAGLAVIITGFISYLKNPISDAGVLPGQNSQIANPASVNCEEKGGAVELREKTAGTVGYCIFDDGSECEEWALWRDDCKKGDRICKDLCSDGICQEIVCLAAGCPCAESTESCPADCGQHNK